MSGLRRNVPAWLLLVVIVGASVVATSVYVIANQNRSDFTLAAVPGSVTLLANGTDSGIGYHKSMEIQPVNGFTGIVTMAVSSPAGIRDSLAIVSNTTGQSPGDQVLLGPSQTLWLFVSASHAGNYSVVVTGTSGRLSHSVTVTLVVRGLVISANPNPAPLPPSSTNTTASQISLTSLNGLSGNFTLTYTSLNSFYRLYATGPTYVIVGSGQTAKFNVTLNTQSSPYGGAVGINIGTAVGSTSYTLCVGTSC